MEHVVLPPVKDLIRVVDAIIAASEDAPIANMTMYTYIPPPMIRPKTVPHMIVDTTCSARPMQPQAPSNLPKLAFKRANKQRTASAPECAAKPAITAPKIGVSTLDKKVNWCDGTSRLVKWSVSEDDMLFELCAKYNYTIDRHNIKKIIHTLNGRFGTKRTCYAVRNRVYYLRDTRKQPIIYLAGRMND